MHDAIYGVEVVISDDTGDRCSRVCERGGARVVYDVPGAGGGSFSLSKDYEVNTVRVWGCPRAFVTTYRTTLDREFLLPLCT